MNIFLVIFLVLNGLASLIRVLDLSAGVGHMGSGERFFATLFNIAMLVCSIVAVVLLATHH